MASKRVFTSRTKARKRAADVVFEADQRGMGRNPDVLRDLLRQRKVITAAQTPLPEYSATIIEGVADNLKAIDKLISSHARVPGLDRINSVDLAVMRVAVWELLANGSEVPGAVAIDEAVSIVKSISTDSSPGFVNAVLDAVRRQLEAPAWKRERVGVPDDDPVEDPVQADSAADSAGSADVAESSWDEAASAGEDAPVRPEDEEPDSAEFDVIEGVTGASLADFSAGSSAGADSSVIDEGGAPIDDDSAIVLDVPADVEQGSGTTETPDTESRASDWVEATDSANTVEGALDSEDERPEDSEEPDSPGTSERRYPTLAELTAADLAELDELLDEY
ncbi:MAG: transcription antitermination factor NusB [Actinomycetaceae bacterium]|nr:transcription antitermination factor NusB [Actinomycetaceae bacterium]